MARRWKVSISVLTVVALYGLIITIVTRQHRTGHLSATRDHSTVAARPSPVHAVTNGNGDTGGLSPPMWSLPGPSRYDGVAAVGFPHTTLGAVGLGYSTLAARFTTDPDMAVSVVRATVLGPTTTLLRDVATGTMALRTRFGLAPTGPTATIIGLSLIGCQVRSATPVRVVAGFEGTLSVEGGSVQGITAEMSAAIVLAWDGTDWKIDPTANLPTPPIEFPTSGAPTAGGWHACAPV